MLWKSEMCCCCQDYRDILKALNKAQADRIKYLEDEILACKEQKQIDLAVKKDLDEKLDTLRERLAQTNASLKRSIQKESGLGERVSYLETIRQSQAKEIERLRGIVNAPNGSCSAYTQQGMQSKIAKQAAEIKRLTEENEKLRDHNAKMSNMIAQLNDNAAKEEILYHDLWLEKDSLKKALDIAAKDADANFERGKAKGMEKIWDELRKCYANRSIGENEKIFGYCAVGDILMKLSPTLFMNKVEQEAKDIQIGDEVEIFDEFCPDDDPHSDIGIVVMIYEPQTDYESRVYTVIGPKFEDQIDDTDIEGGIARKTGKHFDSIPLDYLA